MNPPIPSPSTVPEKTRIVTKRIEWDEEQQCFFLVYTSSVRQRLRCEWRFYLRHPWLLSWAILFFPVVLLVLFLGSAAAKRRPDRLCVFSWGIRDICAGMTGHIPWDECKGIVNEGGDLYILRPWYKSGAYFVHEAFTDSEECRRLENILRSLWESKGARWAEEVAKFQKL